MNLEKIEKIEVTQTVFADIIGVDKAIIANGVRDKNLVLNKNRKLLLVENIRRHYGKTDDDGLTTDEKIKREKLTMLKLKNKEYNASVVDRDVMIKLVDYVLIDVRNYIISFATNHQQLMKKGTLATWETYENLKLGFNVAMEKGLDSWKRYIGNFLDISDDAKENKFNLNIDGNKKKVSKRTPKKK